MNNYFFKICIRLWSECVFTQWILNEIFQIYTVQYSAEKNVPGFCHAIQILHHKLFSHHLIKCLEMNSSESRFVWISKFMFKEIFLGYLSGTVEMKMVNDQRWLTSAYKSGPTTSNLETRKNKCTNHGGSCYLFPCSTQLLLYSLNVYSITTNVLIS